MVMFMKEYDCIRILFVQDMVETSTSKNDFIFKLYSFSLSLSVLHFLYIFIPLETVLEELAQILCVEPLSCVHMVT